MPKNALVISDTHLVPPPLDRVFADLGIHVHVETDPRALFSLPDFRQIDLVVAVVHHDDPTSWNVLQLVSELVTATHVPMVAVGRKLGVTERIRTFDLGACDCLALELPPEELRVRLAVLSSFKERFDNLVDQHVQTILLARKLRQNASRLDEELRLARRLQMDFLPRTLPEVGLARFAARLQPAGWVAGDFYDVFRLDETHVGFYIADAIGHGIPAALLTIFVKRSLQTKRINGQNYELIQPDEALSLLNDDLISADLNQSPFISMIYAIAETSTGRLTYSRAGHPRPAVLRRGEPVEELMGEGPLLGVIPQATFERAEHQLGPQERLVLYTDGVERCRTGDVEGIPAFFQTCTEVNTDGVPLEHCLQSLLDAAVAPRDDTPLHDDVTLLAMEMLPR